MYGLKPSQLSTLIFENTDLWKSDMDVYIRSDNIEKWSQKMGIDTETIRKTTLHSRCNNFYSQTGKTTQVKWVMPIGIGSNKPYFGLQFCPCCLSEDADKPYFRRHWRLAFFTTCLFHSVQLHDRCPKCHHQISLKRLKKRPYNPIYRPMDIVYCSKCNFDLRKTPISFPCEREIEINRIHFMQYFSGYGQAGNQYFHYSNLYFEGARRLLSFLICSPKGERLFSHLQGIIDLQSVNRKTSMGKYLEIELMHVQQRHSGLIILLYLLNDWPHRFIVVCQASNTSTHHIYTPYLTFPYWIYDAIKFSIRTLPARNSKAEHQAIKDYFTKRLKRKIKNYETLRLVEQFFS